MSAAQIKNSFSSIGELDISIAPSALVLKLAATEDALRYFVLSQTHQQIIFFGNYTLHHVTTSAALAAAIQKLFEKDEILQIDFARVIIGLDENYSLIPRELSHVMRNPEQLVTHCSETDIVFDGALEVVQALRALFNHPELLHLNSTFFNLLPHYLNNSTERLFVNVSQKYFDTIFFRNNALQLMNRYEYRAATDFVYFVLLCCDELKIDRQTTELVLLGEVDIQSKIYDICFRYFREIRFIQKPDNLHFAKAFEVYPKHLHFNLYNLGS